MTTAAATVPDYTVTLAGPNTLVLTRRYLPSWAVIVGVLGLLLFLIGLLAFLIRSTETLTITFTPVEGGTRVDVSGLVSQEMDVRLTAVLGGASIPAPEAKTLLPEGGDTPSFDRESPTAAMRMYRSCPRCKEQMRRDASVCPHCRSDTSAWTLHGQSWWNYGDESKRWYWYNDAENHWFMGVGPRGTPADRPPGWRLCPFCREMTRRDLVECHRCARKSKPWVFSDGKWWYLTDGVGWEWQVDEATDTWSKGDGPDPSSLVGVPPAFLDLPPPEYG